MVEKTDLSASMSVEDETPERSTEEIRQDIAARRESLSKTVDRLDERIHQTLDLRKYLYDHPYAVLGIAAGLGFLASGLFRPRPTLGERIMDTLAASAEGLTDRFRDTVGNGSLEMNSGLGGTVKATLIAAITKAVLNSLSPRVRGSQRTPRGLV